MNTTSSVSTSAATEPVPESVLQSIQQALHGLRFGQVTIIVQDGRVIQIDRMERHRLGSTKSSGH